MWRSSLFILAIFYLSSFSYSSIDNDADISAPDGSRLVLVEGGQYDMGDIFGDGNADELPVHPVTVESFYLAQHEITIAQFKKFCEATGYRTSAEAEKNWEKQMSIVEGIQKAKDNAERRRLADEFLEYSGSAVWRTDVPGFTWNPDITWRNPGFEQEEDHPAVALSWNDAMHYCNWLSKQEGLPAAYDTETGNLLDSKGVTTTDITEVKGYRLPTEAEWEYAAREGGRKVRFGNGKNLADADEINFRADSGEYPYLEPGEYRKATVPVGSFKPNSLGLYDMSGNAWEWVHDCYASYEDSDQTNPVQCSGARRVIRGGRWGGDAKEIRVFGRASYEAINRCNNSGFRIARSQ